jgi:hypothetical protein
MVSLAYSPPSIILPSVCLKMFTRRSGIGERYKVNITALTSPITLTLISDDRFILANTEQLHSKIHDMSEHIRRLEEALDHSTAGQHHLLQPDMLNVKSTMELYKMTQPKPDTAQPSPSHRQGERPNPNEYHDSHTNVQVSAVQ